MLGKVILDTCGFKSCVTIQIMIYFHEWPFSKYQALISFREDPKNSQNIEIYPYEVTIMVLHSKKGIPKLHCFFC